MQSTATCPAMKGPEAADRCRIAFLPETPLRDGMNFVSRQWLDADRFRSFNSGVSGQPKRRNPDPCLDRGIGDRSLAVTYFHMGRPHTIIGAGAFHYRVREGIGWYHAAMAARRKGLRCSECCWCAAVVLVESCARVLRGPCAVRPSYRALGCYMVKPHGQLVQVSCTHYCASTPCLSTSWSSTDLQESQGLGTSHLGVGFPLRCFQRLSRPYIATRQCHWHDNRNTRGTSTPVLSY